MAQVPNDWLRWRKKRNEAEVEGEAGTESVKGSGVTRNGQGQPH